MFYINICTHDYFFGLWLNFFRLCQPYQTCSFFLIPIHLGFYDFSRDKSFNFFGCSSFILFSKFSHYKKFKFFYFIFWLLTIPLLLYAEKVEEDTNLQKSSIFISNKFVFFNSLTTFCLFLCFSQYKSLNFFVNLSLLQCPTFFGFYDFSQDKSFNFFGYSPFILFSEFSNYKKIKFLCVPKPSIACVAFWVYIWIIG